MTKVWVISSRCKMACWLICLCRFGVRVIKADHRTPGGAISKPVVDKHLVVVGPHRQRLVRVTALNFVIMVQRFRYGEILAPPSRSYCGRPGISSLPLEYNVLEYLVFGQKFRRGILKPTRSGNVRWKEMGLINGDGDFILFFSWLVDLRWSGGSSSFLDRNILEIR